MVIFLILLIGYFMGSITIFGLDLGSSAILIVALIFGHFGYGVSPIVGSMGLILFVAAVGFIAGPTFFRNFKNKVLAYIMLGIIIISTGALTCIIMIKTTSIPASLLVGMLSGALTSTPGLAAAIEATGSNMASIGYGIAYPFGVLGVVLFVQVVPKVLGINLVDEAAEAEVRMREGVQIKDTPHYKEIDSFGFFSYSIAIILGLFIAAIKVPLPGGASFSLGNSGGPLLAGLLLGHFAHVGRISIMPKIATLKTMREFGLVLFLLGAGTDAGKGFVMVLKEYGVALFILGAIMTIIPMIIGYFVAKKVFKLDIINALGSITGGMTSTPALGSLISATQSDAPTTAYAATYPVALIFVVLACQFIGAFM